ncbi:hypothetical protein EHI_137940 [Entamoeba histolytica HM-1:IMSS]|uniref:Uncharacterized protein n=1 Tax=Entamoeba histolytica (strain ATCC 30459 / HM-1:IMSS / ABRM) TaxID=294381 RepID=C4LZF5_ENTH1|nr:hypothetical protein EHI_137940 [Entamoeba histolytica HM-1:IMSS]EAL48675.2 hypothetical protein EHI_137940 [Entamoeba histolytica HM-1:IMSS]|eukprot:XP_654065.2 hypothetical protein EHI_137940 [Entamoeba histolytica HM-1:IMSS]
MFILLSLVAISFAQNKCSTAISITPHFDVYDSGTFTLTDNNPSTWNCYSSGNVNQNAYVFKFTSDSDASYIASTCYPETVIAPRIIVGTKCENDVTTECIGAEDISQNVCEGHRSKVRFNVLKNQEVFVMVTGVTKNETGAFRLTVNKETKLNNSYCQTAIKLALPITITQDIDTNHTKPDSYKFGHGFWYQFTAKKDKVYINTCNKFTTVSTSISILSVEGANITGNCQGDEPLIQVSKNCGLKSRLAYNVVVGNKYFVFVGFKQHDIYHPEPGTIQTYFSYEADSSTCSSSYAITSFPAILEVEVAGLNKDKTGCGKNNYGFYTSVQGDDNMYAIHTCASINKPTDIEVYVDDCNVCYSGGYRKCGINSYIVMKLEKNHHYYIRASSTDENATVVLNILRVDDVSNFQCSNAHSVLLRNKGDIFSSNVIASNRIPTTTGCLGPVIRQGAWYKIESLQQKTNVVVGVIPTNVNKYTSYLEVKDLCEEPTQCNSFTGLYSFTINKGESKYIFATAHKTLKEVNDLPDYGAFLFYASYGIETRGSSIEKRIMIDSLPYTGVALLGGARSKWSCDEEKESIGIWYGIKTYGGITYVATSCGEETNTNIGVTASGDYYYPYWTCFSPDTESTCGFGSTIQLELYNTIPAINTSILFHAKDVNAQKAFTRVSIYEQNVRPKNSMCSNAEEIHVPAIKYFNTMFSTSSRRICGSTEDGIKGVWYHITAPEDKTLQALTDDSSTFYSHIDMYKECTTNLEESWPKECVAFGDYTTSPVGRKGTIVSYPMKKGDSVYVFVGAHSNTNTGLGRISFSWKEEEGLNDNSTNSEEEDDDGLSAGAIVGIIAAIFIAFIVIVIIVTIIVVVIIKKKGKSYSDF